MKADAKQTLLYASITAVLTGASGMLLAGSGVEASKAAFLSGLKETAQKLLSTEFIGFLMLGAAALAVISLVCLREESKKNAYSAAISGTAIGIAATMAVSGASLERAILSAFLLLGIALMIETAFLKKQEFKKFVSFRTAASASQKAVLVIAIGLFITTAYSVSAEKQKYIQDFESETLKIALGGSQENGSSVLAENAAESIIQMQKQSISQITSTPQYQKLEQRQDIDVQSFVLLINGLESSIDTPETREVLKQQIMQQIGSSQSPVSFDMIKKQAPFIQQLENYYWLIAAFAAFSIFMLLGNLIAANLAAAFAALLSALIPEAKQAKGKGTG